MRYLLRLSGIVFFVIVIATTGIFISRCLFHIIEMRNFDIPFVDILSISVKAGSVGGLVGGLGIYFIPYCSKKISNRKS